MLRISLHSYFFDRCKQNWLLWVYLENLNMQHLCRYISSSQENGFFFNVSLKIVHCFNIRGNILLCLWVFVLMLCVCKIWGHDPIKMPTGWLYEKNLSVHDQWVTALSAVLVGNASIYERGHLFIRYFSNLIAEDFIKLKG